MKTLTGTRKQGSAGQTFWSAIGGCLQVRSYMQPGNTTQDGGQRFENFANERSLSHCLSAFDLALPLNSAAFEE